MSGIKTEHYLRGAIGVLLVALVFVIYDSMTEKVVGVGDTAPSFSIATDDGRTVSAANFGGKLLVLNFWATWCPPCVQEMPSLDQFQKTLAPNGVVVLGISVDKNEQLYRSFLAKARVSFLTARDPDAKINADYGTFKYPETYIIDANGKVLRKYIGPEDWTNDRMLNDVRSLL
ncbi:MAG TPA: TlpA disulfide reductase family protein [Bryobacteraceae bacterium]|nr:TlpA disulfide reductase family protein [Bryobacteraceae bacterium]